MLWLHSQNSHQKNLNNNPSTSALARLCTSCLYANGKWKSNMELMGQQKVLIGYNVARTTKKDVAFGSTAGFYVMCAWVVHCSLGIHFDTWPTELTGVRCSVELGARSGGVRDACALLLSFPALFSCLICFNSFQHFRGKPQVRLLELGHNPSRKRRTLPRPRPRGCPPWF